MLVGEDEVGDVGEVVAGGVGEARKCQKLCQATKKNVQSKKPHRNQKNQFRKKLRKSQTSQSQPNWKYHQTYPS